MAELGWWCIDATDLATLNELVVGGALERCSGIVIGADECSWGAAQVLSGAAAAICLSASVSKPLLKNNTHAEARFAYVWFNGDVTSPRNIAAKELSTIFSGIWDELWRKSFATEFGVCSPKLAAALREAMEPTVEILPRFPREIAWMQSQNLLAPQTHDCSPSSSALFRDVWRFSTKSELKMLVDRLSVMFYDAQRDLLEDATTRHPADFVVAIGAELCSSVVLIRAVIAQCETLHVRVILHVEVVRALRESAHAHVE